MLELSIIKEKSDEQHAKEKDQTDEPLQAQQESRVTSLGCRI